MTTPRPRPQRQGGHPTAGGLVIPLFPTDPAGLADGQAVRVRQPDGTWRHGHVNLTAYSLGVGPVGGPPTRTYIPVVFEELCDATDVEPT